MRQHMTTSAAGKAAVVAGVLLLGGAPAGTLAGSPVGSPGCVAAAEIVSAGALALTAPTVTISDAAPAVPPMLRPDYLWAVHAWTGERPSQDLRSRWERTSQTSAVGGCPQLKQVLGPELIKSGSPPAIVEEGHIQYSIGMPVLDASGKRALLLVARRQRGLGGGVDLIYFGRDAGKWRELGRRAVVTS